MSTEKHRKVEWFAGAIVFIAFIAAHLLFGAKAAIKVAGAACIATGILWIFRRSIPVGIEGRSPSFYLGGWSAILAGLGIASVGIGLLAYSGIAVCLLGWASAGECQ